MHNGEKRSMRGTASIVKVLAALSVCVHLASCYSNDFDAHSPAVAFDPSSGRYLVVYTNDHSNHPISHLYGKFIDQEGAMRGNEFEINASGTFNYCTALGYDGVHARFAAFWVSSGLVGRPDAGAGPPVLYGQLISADGTLFGPLVTLSTTEPGIGCPSVAFGDSQQTFLAVWGEADHSLLGYFLPASGGAGASKFPISGDMELDSVPSAAYDGITKRFLVAWLSADHSAIKGRFINADGSFGSSESSLSAIGGAQTSPTVVFDGINARYLVAWAHQDEGSGTSTLKGLLLNADGSPYLTEFDVSSAGRNVLPRTSAVFDPANANYYIVFGDGGSGSDLIYGQVVSASGVLDASVSGENILLSYPDFPGDERPKVALDSINHRFYAVWGYGPVKEGGKEQIFADIHGRLVNTDGTAAGSIAVLSNGGR